MSRYDILFVNPIISRRLECWQAADDVNVRVVRAAACDEPAAGVLTYLSGCLGRRCYRRKIPIGQPQKNAIGKHSLRQQSGEIGGFPGVEIKAAIDVRSDFGARNADNGVPPSIGIIEL